MKEIKQSGSLKISFENFNFSTCGYGQCAQEAAGNSD